MFAPRKSVEGSLPWNPISPHSLLNFAVLRIFGQQWFHKLSNRDSCSGFDQSNGQDVYNLVIPSKRLVLLRISEHSRSTGNIFSALGGVIFLAKIMVWTNWEGTKSIPLSRASRASIHLVDRKILDSNSKDFSNVLFFDLQIRSISVAPVINRTIAYWRKVNTNITRMTLLFNHDHCNTSQNKRHKKKHEIWKIN